MRAQIRRRVLASLLAASPAACGTFLGLDDYRNAPPDAGLTLDSRQGADDVEQPPSDATLREMGDDGTPVANDDAGTDGAMDAYGAAETAADGPATIDGATDGPAEADSGAYLPPAGWTVVAFTQDPTATTCPAGYTNRTPVVFGTASPMPGACTCDSSCTVTEQPSCVTGPVNASFDTNGSATCGMAGSVHTNPNPGGCNAATLGKITGGTDIEWIPPGPTGGVCSPGNPVPQPSAVTFGDAGLVCSPVADGGASCSNGGSCSPSVGLPFIPCVVQEAEADGGHVDAGTVCPPGPFSVAHQVGDGATVDCSACDCTVQTTCTNQTMTYFRDSMCSYGALPMPADGTCFRAAGGSNTYGSYVFSATASATCTGNSTVAAVALANEMTLCCTQ